MNKFQVDAVIAGVMFGLYPLLLSRSEAKSNINATLFSFVVAVCILPFAIAQVKSIDVSDCKWIIGAGMLSAIGLVCMSNFITSSSKNSIGLLIILMIVVQASVTATYQIIMDRGISPTRLLGFVFAAVAIILLNRK